MQINNSITNTLFDITKLSDNIKWYSCGPTIYNDSHIGHARTYIIFDTMVKYLRSQGKTVTYAMNITDIDDKIVKKVYNIYKEKNPNKENNDEINKEELFNLYNEFIKNQETRFFEDLQKLNIDLPNKFARVSDLVDKMIEFIQELINKEYAYESNGSVYFDTKKFYLNYPSIMGNNNENDMSQKDSFNSEKRDIKDFALWKAEKENDISWTSPWGYGRLGWHLECSVMMNEMLGEYVDIHSGGCDLKFPHHHNEYLQTTAYFNNPNWIKCFVHSGHLYVNQEKMSQSIGNFITIRQYLEKYTPNQIRILFLSTKWNGTLNLTDGVIKSAVDLDNKISNFMRNLEFYKNKELPNKDNVKLNNFIQKFNENIQNAFNDDFDTQRVFTLIMEFINEMYKNKYTELNPIIILDEINKILHILGLKYESKENISSDSEKYITSIVNIRDKLRELISVTTDKETKRKLFEITDYVRDIELPNLGVKLEDTKESSRWFFI